jgi:dTDP-4-amino-4,6-dideoxygalactose transaminase
MNKIPFNKPCLTGKELEYIKMSVDSGKVSGDGIFTAKCHHFFEKRFGITKALLTTSCTHALEMAFLLFDLYPGDEVILPSYTFVSTANAFVLRGAKPVFVDIRPDTLNMDEEQILSKITSRTRAVCPVHYAGVGCEMRTIMKVAQDHGLYVVEDAAQGVNAKYGGRYLGSMGHLGAYSFHETKNYICGEGGALLVNDPQFVERAEIVREKGADRSKFFRGEVDKYSWVDVGSSYLPSDILAAYLYAQLENLEKINDLRQGIFEHYYENLKDLEQEGLMKLPHLPPNCTSNYHMFYLLFPSLAKRDEMMQELRKIGIHAIFHYLPLHTSAMGRRFGYKFGDLPITEDVSGRLLRLPFYNTLTRGEQDYVIANLRRLVLQDRNLSIRIPRRAVTQ